MQIQQTITLEPQDLVDALEAHIQKTLGVDAEVVVDAIALPDSTQVAYTLQVNSITKVKTKTRGATTAVPAEGGKRRGRKPKAQVEAEQAAALAAETTVADSIEQDELSEPTNTEKVDLGTEIGTFEPVGAVQIEPVEPPSLQDNPFNVEAPAVIGSSVFGG